jgi:DNA protecting protein DprA
MQETLFNKGTLFYYMPDLYQLLSMKYSVPILRFLANSKNGAHWRQINHQVVTGSGSSRSTTLTLIELIKAEWVRQDEKTDAYFITSRGRDVLSFAERGKAQFSVSMAEKGSGGIEYWMALNDFELNADRFGIRDFLEKEPDIEALFHHDVKDLKSKSSRNFDQVKWEVEQFRMMNIEGYRKLKEDLPKEGVQIIKYDDDRYPLPLKKSENHHPLVLYHKGALLDFSNCVAIVGTRNPSSHTQEKIRKTSQSLAREGYTIVSGLALGTDTEAHIGALDVGGRTIAVIPNIGKITPLSNLDIAEAITEKGAVIGISSPLSGLPKGMWVRRNKVISGLSKCLCAAVSGESKGTFHQVGFALKQGLKVFALKPPSDDDPSYFAYKKLVEMGATPFSSEDDILTYLKSSA